MKRMKEILDAENFHPYLMTQPLGWMCPEVENHKEGYAILPEVPFGKHFKQKHYTTGKPRKQPNICLY